MNLFRASVVLLCLMMNISCGKEDNIIQKNMVTLEHHSSSFGPTEFQVMIDDVQDTVMLPGWSDVASNAGMAEWNCAYVEVLAGNIYKVVVPYRNHFTNEIENLLIAFKIGTTWKVKFINRYHYLFMVDITKHLTNKYYYISLLMEFEKAEEICANPTGIQGKIEFRIEDMIIITEDGTLIIIDGITGQMFVVSGPGLYGCCNHTGWSSPINIVWRGSTIWWTNNPGNTRGSGFNANEDGWINSGWFDTGISGGGGGTSSTIPNCQIPEYWSQIDPQIKKDYIRAFSSLVNEFEVITCTQPNLTPDEQEECISNEDLLCLGLDSDCLQIANGQLDVNNYTECMGAVLNRLPCLNEALNYINENNLNITIEELEIQVGGFGGNCTNQQDFDYYVDRKIWLRTYINHFNLGININTLYELIESCEFGNGFSDCVDEAVFLSSDIVTPPSQDEHTPTFGFKECFVTPTTTSVQSITLYVEQPIPGTSVSYAIGGQAGGGPLDIFKSGQNANWGHSFIGINQTDGSSHYTRVTGYYPTSGVSPFDKDATGRLYDDDFNPYNISVTIPLNSTQFTLMVDLIDSFADDAPDYNLNNYNCTDWCISIINILQIIELGDALGTWPLGGIGSTPGALGEFIRNLSLPAGVTRNIIGGLPPTRNCHD